MFPINTIQDQLACVALQVYVPDDDIIQLSTSISDMFDIQETYGLELAQPTLCSAVESYTVHVNDFTLWKEATTVLRYGNFVEIMVPLFSMRFFNTDVIKTLSTAASGMLMFHFRNRVEQRCVGFRFRV